MIKNRVHKLFKYAYGDSAKDSSKAKPSLLSYDDDDYQYHGGHGHGNEDPQKAYAEAESKLCKVTSVSLFFIAAQLTGGILAGSIAIMCDTAHLATDMIGFIIGLCCLKLSLRDADESLTFGWQRAEVIGSLVSIIILISITIFLVGEAIDRVLTPGEIDADMMMFTAIVGLIFNLI